MQGCSAKFNHTSSSVRCWQLAAAHAWRSLPCQFLEHLHAASARGLWQSLWGVAPVYVHHQSCRMLIGKKITWRCRAHCWLSAFLVASGAQARPEMEQNISQSAAHKLHCAYGICRLDEGQATHIPNCRVNCGVCELSAACVAACDVTWWWTCQCLPPLPSGAFFLLLQTI